MYFLRGETIDTLYQDLVQLVYEKGEDVESRGMGVRELRNVAFTISDVNLPFVLSAERALNVPYCIVEPIYLLLPQTPLTADSCCFYVGKFLKANVVNPETGLMDGWYGDRINNNGRNQLVECYKLLKEDPGTRQAIMTIHDSKEELGKDTRDKPCTVSVQFLIRGGELECTVTMRGNDVILGTPQNFAMFTFFQRMLACWLKIRTGQYTHFTTSLHIYDRDQEKALRIIREEKPTYPRGANNIDWSWSITDPQESLRQCALFAIAEYETRRDGSSRTTDHLHYSLRNLLRIFIEPYRRQEKERKEKIRQSVCIFRR